MAFLRYAAFSALCFTATVFVVCNREPAEGAGGTDTRGRLDTGAFPAAKNIIIMIPDGCGLGHVTASRWYKGSSLALDEMRVGLMRTHNVHSLITGSAAAATAFAAGRKTRVGYIGMMPDTILVPKQRSVADSLKYRPAATVMEAARLSGRATGLVMTSNFNHATPAAFVCHWHDRDAFHTLALQMLDAGLTVVFGAGTAYLDANLAGDLSAELGRRGIPYARDLEGFRRLPPAAASAWGLFAAKHLANDLDRRTLGIEEPSLAEMTDKALQILSNHPDGFMLVVEGSKVDWSSHDNDPVGVVSEFLAFDEAVGVALDYTKSHDSTLLVVFPDHDNGGMTIGTFANDEWYKRYTYDTSIAVLRRASLTAEAILDSMESVFENTGRLRSGTAAGLVSKALGLEGLDAIERRSVREMTQFVAMIPRGTSWRDSVGRRLGRLISNRAYIGWTTYMHVGNDVPVWYAGAAGEMHTIDNTDMARMIFCALGTDPRALNGRLFVEAGAAFAGAKVRIDTANAAVYDKKGKVEELTGGFLRVDRGGIRAELPLNRARMIVNRPNRPDTSVSLEGLTIYSLPAHKVYVPRQAGSMFDAMAHE
ncbi:MAG: alkaline phosphatase [Chitinivibrionales bacterium]|nr:alkaline phosphatase [Chitinivibrionales bacterium]MBD3395593.1 alkaline phosphatase [Chitinivibrionales bacterium]